MHVLHVFLPRAVPLPLQSALLPFLQCVAATRPLNSLLLGDLPLDGKKIPMVQVGIHKVAVVIEETGGRHVPLCPWIPPKVLQVYIQEGVILWQSCDLRGDLEAPLLRLQVR